MSFVKTQIFVQSAWAEERKLQTIVVKIAGISLIGLGISHIQLKFVSRIQICY